MSQAIFLFEVLGVLAFPGPTNSLLFVSGVTRGFKASLLLIVAEVAAYCASISLWLFVIAPAAGVHSTVGQLLRIVCSIYLAQMAVWLWQWREEGVDAAPPKALLFAFLIFPPADANAMRPYFAGSSLICTGVACCWIAAGALFHSTALHKRYLTWLYRGEAFLLAGFAIIILISAYYDS